MRLRRWTGAFVGHGETFSFNDMVGPRTKEAGYVPAINGRGGKKLGGGVSQVATTLYLALKQLGGVDYRVKRTYGNQFTGGYVDSGYDAVVTDYRQNVDFVFENGGGGFIIHIWATDTAVECELAAAGPDGAGTDSAPTASPSPAHGAKQTTEAPADSAPRETIPPAASPSLQPETPPRKMPPGADRAAAPSPMTPTSWLPPRFP